MPEGEVTLTPTSYLVLGLVGRLGPCTSYEMKRAVAGSIGYFWSFPHSQLYAEPARLATAGLLAEEQEETGRRRRTYRLTPAGRAALRAWLADPVDELTEIRDLGLLKVFFGGQTDPRHVRELAVAKVRAHEERLAEYEAIDAAIDGQADPYEVSTLAMGLRFERAALGFWRELAAEGRVQTRPAPTSASQ
jgi:DNA-binding PadR family transcriptional regulator